MFGWFRKAFNPDPSLRTVSSMENGRLGFDHIVGFSVGENTEHPRVGDVIIVLHTRGCMAEEVYKDERLRVIGQCYDQRETYGEQAESIMLVPTTDRPISISNLRKHATVPRTWVMMD